MISKKASEIVAYTAGEQPGGGFIKLNTNENPYTLPFASALKRADLGKIRLYPDPDCMELRAEASVVFGMPPEYFFFGNGSDEVLAFLFAALFDPEHVVLCASAGSSGNRGKDVCFPDITYSFYPVFARLFDISYRNVPVDGGLKVDIRDYKGLQECQGIVIANPNAPTGLSLSKGDIDELAGTDPTRPVVVDEAYVDFAVGNVSATDLLEKHRNLIIVRTFSKSCSLAGLRLGFAMAHPDVISALKKIRDSFNSYPVDFLAQTLGRYALKNYAAVLRNCKKVAATRARFAGSLKEMNFDVLESDANFVFAKPVEIEARELFLALRERKILVRHFQKPRISDRLRITIGTDAEMDEVVKAIRAILP